MSTSLFRKKWVIVLIAIPAVILLLEASIRLYLFLNPEILRLTELQEQTQKAFEDYAKTVTTAGEEKKLSELTPFEWDYVFYAGYLMSGIDSVDYAINSKEINTDISDYIIFDERFGEHDEGLVFLNQKEKFILTVPLSDILGSKSIEAAGYDNSCLKSNFGPSSNKFFIFLECEKGD